MTIWFLLMAISLVFHAWQMLGMQTGTVELIKHFHKPDPKTRPDWVTYMLAFGPEKMALTWQSNKHLLTSFQQTTD